MSALDKLKQEMEEARKDGGFVCLWPQEAFALIAESEQRERKVERVVTQAEWVCDLATDTDDEPLHKAVAVLRSDLAALQADSPPPIARDPIPDTGGKINW